MAVSQTTTMSCVFLPKQIRRDENARRDLPADQRCNFTALARDPDYPHPYHNRGLVYSELDRVDEAIADLTKTIELEPFFWSAYRHRSILYAIKGDHAASYQDFLTARENGY